jgi:putative nucleotidyltransferase with HDIG domain
MRLAYRAIQFFHTLKATPGPDDLALVRQYLIPELLGLFERMSSTDQVHSVQVLRTLLEEGEDHPDLLAAALLHDVGKSLHRPSALERIVVVLTQSLAPGFLKRWGQGPATGWRRPYVIAVQHARWGAEMVARTGGSETLVELIRSHQDPPLDAPGTDRERLLQKLQLADGKN